MVAFRKMCDKCYRMLGDNEQMYAIKLIDNEDKIRIFKGHKECLDEVVQIMAQLYGTSEGKKNEENPTD